jgi:hypothetical protein
MLGYSSEEVKQWDELVSGEFLCGFWQLPTVVADAMVTKVLEKLASHANVHVMFGFDLSVSNRVESSNDN